jgi:hypothetical protein
MNEVRAKKPKSAINKPPMRLMVTSWRWFANMATHISVLRKRFAPSAEHIDTGLGALIHCMPTMNVSPQE